MQASPMVAPLLFTFLISAGGSAHAGISNPATCPKYSQLRIACQSFPNEDDSKAVSLMFDSVSICATKNDSRLLAVKKDSTNKTIKVDETIARVGANEYLIRDKNSHWFSFLTSFGNPLSGVKGTLQLKHNDKNYFSNYKCEKYQ